MVPRKDLLCIDRIRAIVRFSVFGFLVFAQTGLRVSGSPRQDKHEALITIRLRNVLLRDALNKIGDVAHLSFIYVSDKALDRTKISISVHREKIGVLLERLLRPYSLRYTMVDNRIIVYRANGKPGHPMPAATGKPGGVPVNGSLSY
jgi:hypothetical protein